jgi:hypothetical protein
VLFHTLKQIERGLKYKKVTANNKVSIQSLPPPVYCYKKQTGGFIMSRPIVPLTVPQAHHFKTDRRAKLSISYKIKGKSKVKASFNDAEKEIEVPGNKNI